jgi:hypothetical protein
MSAAKIARALGRFKLRPLRVRDEPRWAVYDGEKQVTSAAGYDAALKKQRAMTVAAIMEITQC